MLTFAVPGTVVGIGYILAFNNPSFFMPVTLTGTSIIIIALLIFRNLPVGIRNGVAAIEQIDPSIEEASIDLGADIVINSLTKFMSGHADAIAGSITASKKLIDEIQPISMLCGTPGDPYAAFAMTKSFHTMDLRVKKQMANAAKLAAALEANPYVSKVYHPSLESFPQHDLAMKMFRSKEEMSGMMSFIVPEDESKFDDFLQSLHFAHYAMTLGGLRTTLAHPCTSSHSHMPDDKRRAMGITPGLFRLSVGIEEADDLIADFTQALEVFGK